MNTNPNYGGFKMNGQQNENNDNLYGYNFMTPAIVSERGKEKMKNKVILRGHGVARETIEQVIQFHKIEMDKNPNMIRAITIECVTENSKSPE